MPAMHNSNLKLIWDFTIQTDQHLVHNHPDIVYVDILQKHCFLIEILIPGDSQIAQKATEKLERYTYLKIEIQKMWSFRTAIAGVNLGRGTGPPGL